MSKWFKSLWFCIKYLFFIIFITLSNLFLNTYFEKGSEFRLTAYVLAFIVNVLILCSVNKLEDCYKKKKGLL